MPIESIEIEAEIEVNKNITIGHKLKYPTPSHSGIAGP